MATKEKVRPDLHVIPMLRNESLYVGTDIGKVIHAAGFLSPTLLTRHQRFESCPALSFENSREGFCSLVDRITSYVPLTQVYVVLEMTDHYHRALLQYLQEMDISVYVLHVQKRQAGMLKTDKRDALGLVNHFYTVNLNLVLRLQTSCKQYVVWLRQPRLLSSKAWFDTDMS